MYIRIYMNVLPGPCDSPDKLSPVSVLGFIVYEHQSV